MNVNHIHEISFRSMIQHPACNFVSFIWRSMADTAMKCYVLDEKQNYRILYKDPMNK